jgi:hypothetical protein
MVQTLAYIKDTSTWDLVSFVGKIFRMEECPDAKAIPRGFY